MSLSGYVPSMMAIALPWSRSRVHQNNRYQDHFQRHFRSTAQDQASINGCITGNFIISALLHWSVHSVFWRLVFRVEGLCTSGAELRTRIVRLSGLTSMSRDANTRVETSRSRLAARLIQNSSRISVRSTVHLTSSWMMEATSQSIRKFPFAL